MLAEWTGHPSQPIQPRSTNQNILCHSEPLNNAFHQNIKSPMNPFGAKTVKLIYNVVPYGDHDTEMVNNLASQ